MKLDLRAPHQKYFTKSGKQVPGVTTVQGILAKDALLNWTGVEERNGILAFMGDGVWSAERLRAALPKTAKGTPALFSVAKRDRAADVGTIAHARIEAWHKGMTLSPEGLDPADYAKSEAPFLRFKAMWEREGLKLIHSELQMVSDLWEVGGTADCIAETPTGRIQLRDTKTGKPWYNGRPYATQISQVAAYASMFLQTTGTKVDDIIIDRIGREEDDPGDTYELTREEREKGLSLFVSALQAYNCNKALEALYR
jgi:hypothetical protein